MTGLNDYDDRVHCYLDPACAGHQGKRPPRGLGILFRCYTCRKELRKNLREMVSKP